MWKHIVMSIRSHRRWITVLGAFIVFTTYAVKEGRRESVKDQLAAINGLRDRYDAMSRHREEMDAMQEANNAIAHVINNDAPPDRFGPTVESALYDAAEIHNEDVHMGEELTETDVLGMPFMREEDDEKKPRSERWREKLYVFFPSLDRESEASDHTSKRDCVDEKDISIRCIRRKAYDAHGKLSHASDNVLDARTNEISLNARGPIGPQLNQAMNNLTTADQAAHQACEDYRLKAVTKGIVKQAVLSAEYETFSAYSWVLFAIGWSVALLGKLLEPECAAGEPVEVD